MSKLKADYTFRQACDVCGQKPVLKDLGMCSTCTFGERSSMWEWLDDGVVQKEHKAAEKYVFDMFAEVDLMDRKGNVDPIKAMLLHIDQPVLDRIEKVLA